MDAPPIQYARTEDGVNLAYWTLGEGPALVYAPSVGSHAQRVWEVPPAREFFEQLAERYRVIYFDPRTSGLSDQAPIDVSLEGFAADIPAVFEVAELDSALIFSESSNVHAAIRFAATQPAKVSGLALYGSALSYPDWKKVSSTGGVIDLVLGAQTEAQFDAARKAFISIVDRVTYEDFVKLASGMGELGTKRAFESIMEWDASEDAASVVAPTLVLARQDDKMYPVEIMQPLAAAIPGARFLIMPGKGSWAFDGDPAPMLKALEDLQTPRPRDHAEPRVQGLRTLLFTDLESSTALTQSLGDAKAQEVLRGHNDAVRQALADHGGDEVKHTGDGIFAAFGSAVSAVEAALQIRRDLAGGEVRVRIGLNAGEPIAEDGDYFGSAVQLAARVCDRAEPGQVLVSNVVRELCSGKLFQSADQGEATLNGFPEPVRLFVVGEAPK